LVPVTNQNGTFRKEANMATASLCSFCGSLPSVAITPNGKVGCCGRCARPHGELHELFERAKKGRLPDRDRDRDAEARRVGLMDDELPDEAVALSLLDVFYPGASQASRAAHYPTVLAQLKFQRTRAPQRRQAAQLSAMDNFARRQGLIPPSEVQAMIRRTGLRVQGDAPADGTTLATGPGRAAQQTGALTKAEIRRKITAAGLAC
jgi:hypothetical protein